MKTVGVTYRTSLSERDLAMLFKSTSERIFGTAARRALGRLPGHRGAGGRMEFFTPAAGDSPFDRFDVSEPSFAVGVMGPQGGVVNAALSITLHMYVYPDGVVELVGPYQFSRVSKGKVLELIEQYESALLAADPSAART